MWMRTIDHRWTTMIHSIHSRAIRWWTIISLRLEYWRRNRNRIVVIQPNFNRKEFVRRIIQVTEDYFWRQKGEVRSSRFNRLVEWSDHDERSDHNECQSMCWESIEDSQWDVFESIGRITDNGRFIIDQQQQSANVVENEKSVLRRHSVEISSSKSSFQSIDWSSSNWYREGSEKERCHIPALFLFVQRDQDEGKSLERLPDGIILHRGPSFGLALGEPLIRRDDLNGHSIDVLDRLLSRATCRLMREHQIQTVEDLVRLFLVKGQDRFTELMVHFFHVDRWMVEQLSSILMNWANRLN